MTAWSSLASVLQDWNTWHTWLGVSVAASVGTVAYILYPSMTSPLRTLPGPPASSLVLGHLTALSRSSYQTFFDWVTKYGNTLFVRFGRWPVLVTTDIELIKLVNLGQFKDFHDRPQAFAPNQKIKHLLWARGAYWKSVRNAISPAFSNKNLSIFAPQMNAAADRLTERLTAARVAGQEVDILECFGQMTMEVIGGTAFGVDLSPQGGNKAAEFAAAANIIFQSSGNSTGSLLRLLLPPLGDLYYYVPIIASSTRRLYAALDTLSEFGKQQILTRRGKPAAEQAAGFLQLLLGAKDPETGRALTDEEIIEDCLLFMLAGYETTANTLAFTVYLVAQHPEVEELLRKEIAELDDGQPLTYETIQKYKYAYNVIQEALRLFPPASAVARDVEEDTQLNDLSIPKGTIVFMPIYTLHRDPTLFPEPLLYRPERFTEDKNAFIPFGLGPRMCIGYRFAMAEAVCALVHLYKHVSFTLSESLPSPLPLRQVITLGPACPVMVKVHAPRF